MHALHRAHWHWLSLDPNRELSQRLANATAAAVDDLARRPNSCTLELGGAVHVQCGSRYEKQILSDQTLPYAAHRFKRGFKYGADRNTRA